MPLHFILADINMHIFSGCGRCRHRVGLLAERVLNSLEPAQNKTRSERAALHCSPADEALAVLVVTMAVALVALLLPLLLPTAEAVVVVVF